MEEGRCPTCNTHGRKPLSSTLLQVATLQAHMRACDLRPPDELPSGVHAHDTNLASRALAAKRRKSVANFKLTLPPEELPSVPSSSRAVTHPATTQDQHSRMLARRNTWCYASGTSAVAIDNKIEQAMDLVKSHLMFAVREEVEVLKERIAELMERITQLEMENTYLRAHASQDTLAQLPAPGAKPAPLPPAGPPPPAS